MKIAFDEHVPPVMRRVLDGFAKDKTFIKGTGVVSFCSARDYAPSIGEPNYIAKSDVPWIHRFADDGGRVIISGDTKMRTKHHERAALVQTKMIVVFFESHVGNWKYWHKCSLLVHWWPVIWTAVKKAKGPRFFCVPANWAIEGELKVVPHDDLQLVKIETQKAAQPAVAAARKRKREQTNQSGLFDQSTGGGDG